MLTFPNAKINLGLYITGKRDDGFHNLESIFLPITWTDVLEIIPSEKFQFEQTGISIPDDGKPNLCEQAYLLLKNDFDLPPVHIHLHKIIPIGAGLGGGSADASFTLKTLNQLFDLKLTSDNLENYARQLGSDCAFFIENEIKYCYEKGDQFQEFDKVDFLKNKFWVVIYPNIHIATKMAYQGIQNYSQEDSLLSIFEKPIEDWTNILKNDFERNLLKEFPILKSIKTQLYELGAIYASMTGSGSTIFGIFEEEIDLKNDFQSDFVLWQGKLMV